jgi:hypothetical protein
MTRTIRMANGEGRLELMIAGYQLNEGEHGDGFNCLNVDGIVWHPHGDWSFRARFCSINCLVALADWLDVVATGGTPDVTSVGGFTSCALVFAVFGSERPPAYSYDPAVLPVVPDILRVTFGDSTYPPWYNMHATERVSMDFALSKLDLKSMAAELREQLRVHPPR